MPDYYIETRNKATFIKDMTDKAGVDVTGLNSLERVDVDQQTPAGQVLMQATWVGPFTSWDGVIYPNEYAYVTTYNDLADTIVNGQFKKRAFPGDHLPRVTL
jgi:hypothetical protein